MSSHDFDALRRTVQRPARRPNHSNRAAADLKLGSDSPTQEQMIRAGSSPDEWDAGIRRANVAVMRAREAAGWLGGTESEPRAGILGYDGSNAWGVERERGYLSTSSGRTWQPSDSEDDLPSAQDIQAAYELKAEELFTLLHESDELYSTLFIALDESLKKIANEDKEARKEHYSERRTVEQNIKDVCEWVVDNGGPGKMKSFPNHIKDWDSIYQQILNLTNKQDFPTDFWLPERFQVVDDIPELGNVEAAPVQQPEAQPTLELKHQERGQPEEPAAKVNGVAPTPSLEAQPVIVMPAPVQATVQAQVPVVPVIIDEVKPTAGFTEVRINPALNSTQPSVAVGVPQAQPQPVQRPVQQPVEQPLATQPPVLHSPATQPQNVANGVVLVQESKISNDDAVILGNRLYNCFKSFREAELNFMLQFYREFANSENFINDPRRNQKKDKIIKICIEIAKHQGNIAGMQRFPETRTAEEQLHEEVIKFYERVAHRLPSNLWIPKTDNSEETVVGHRMPAPHQHRHHHHGAPSSGQGILPLMQALRIRRGENGVPIAQSDALFQTQGGGLHFQRELVIPTGNGRVKIKMGGRLGPSNGNGQGRGHRRRDS